MGEAVPLPPDWDSGQTEVLAVTPTSTIYRIFSRDGATKIAKCLTPLGVKHESLGVDYLSWRQGRGAVDVLDVEGDAILLEDGGSKTLYKHRQDVGDAATLETLGEIVATLLAEQQQPPSDFLPLEQHLEFLFLPTTEQPVLELRSAITDIDYPIEAMPRIALRPVNDSMVGLGLGETQVRVVRLQPDGTEANVLTNQRATVEVTSGGAIPEPSLLNFQAGDTHFTLHSRGLEDVTVRVTAGAHSDTVTIPQRFPTTPVLAALLGGAIGGFSRRFSRGASGGSGVTRVAEGLAVAIIAYVAGVLGVGYLGIPAAVVGTEAGAFLTGALTGFAGKIIAEAVAGDAERLDMFARLPNLRFPGGPARTAVLALGMAWFKMRDMLGLSK